VSTLAGGTGSQAAGRIAALVALLIIATTAISIVLWSSGEALGNRRPG
jgi:hypothetical protein